MESQLLPMLGFSAAFLLWMAIPRDDDDDPPGSPITH